MNQPPTFWSLVEKWNTESANDPFDEGETCYVQGRQEAADELAALVKAHTEELKRLGFRQSPYNTEGICVHILGVPREEGK